LTKEQMIKFW